MYKRIDQKYIKPCLLRENHFRDPKIIETFENLTNKDAMEFMKRNPTQVLHSMTPSNKEGLYGYASTLGFFCKVPLLVMH